MTALQVIVTSAEEAQAAIAAGVTMIFAAAIDEGLPAPLSETDLRAILAVAGARAEVVAAAGGLTPDGLASLAATGVAALVLPVPDGDAGAALLSRTGRSLATSVRLIAAFPAFGRAGLRSDAGGCHCRLFGRVAFGHPKRPMA